jgi:hypothetical protein
MTVGKRTVRTGSNKIRFDGWCLSINNTSFLNMMVKEVKKRAHSRATLVRFVIPMSNAYMVLIAGQNSCVFPVI